MAARNRILHVLLNGLFDESQQAGLCSSGRDEANLQRWRGLTDGIGAREVSVHLSVGRSPDPNIWRGVPNVRDAFPREQRGNSGHRTCALRSFFPVLLPKMQVVFRRGGPQGSLMKVAASLTPELLPDDMPRFRQSHIGCTKSGSGSPCLKRDAAEDGVSSRLTSVLILRRRC